MSEIECIATGRSQSCFDFDMFQNESLLRERLSGSNILIIGAAGSIGASVVLNLIPYNCKSMTLVDLSENNLVELVRDLRSQNNFKLPEKLDILPLCFGSPEFEYYIKSQKQFDYIFNLSAIKHVRSEENIFTISRMFKTNVLYLHNFLSNLDYKPKKVFSVSTDKAVNPANLMGASKRMMEQVLQLHSDKFDVSCARFANVAFSDGSLPYGFLQRISKNQCISAPNDIKRFFISHQEAGQLCVLAAILGENGDVFYPKLESVNNEKSFDDIAREVLRLKGYEVVECNSELAAKQEVENITLSNKWPCYFSSSATSGEKAYEEFYTIDEAVNESKFKKIGIVNNKLSSKEVELFLDGIEFLQNLMQIEGLNKNDIVKRVSSVIPTLNHIETGKSLNQKM